MCEGVKTVNKIENCTFIKTLLMMSVVLYHSCVFWSGGWFSVLSPINESNTLAVLSQFLNSFHVYCFVFVSGYLFYYLKYEKGKYDKYGEFIKKKIIRLLFPYWAVCLFWVAPITAYLYHYSFKDFVFNYVLGISPSQLWFILALFWIFVFIWPISNAIRNSTLIALFVSGTAFVIGLIGAKYLLNLFCFFTGLQFLTFFILGFKIRQFNSEGLKRIKWYICSILFVVLFLIPYFVNFGKLSIVYSYMLHIVGALTAFLVLQKLSMSTNWKRNKAVAILNKYSMSIYLLHQQIIYFVLSLLNGLTEPWIIALVSFLMSISISLCISRLLSFNRVSCMLIGKNN